MTRRIIFLLLFFSITDFSFADTPGKREMHDSKITFQDVSKCSPYVFYWGQAGMDHAEDTISNDKSVFLMASRGAPYQYQFWGINTKTKKSTDTIFFGNYYSPDYVIILKGIHKDSIVYDQKELSNANTVVKEENTDSITNKELVADAQSYRRKHALHSWLLYGAGIAGLGGLIWFFIRRRKNITTATQGTGS
ncbi:MAG: hypothetical protein JST86_08660 [Bacteroidetes bacterium]|nr:hypothetical protein [Bacteroidota bacterium]